MFGILGYGTYVPTYRVRVETLFRNWGLDHSNRKPVIEEKSVPAMDEDAITIGIEAARSALQHGQINASDIGCCLVGSESKPYAVKPSAVVIANALGATPYLSGGDIEFACKAGTEALRGALCFVKSGAGTHALAIGTDVAQFRPGDELEFSAAAGGAAFIVGAGQHVIATIDDFVSFSTDTTDFFRADGQPFPAHGFRFTGGPSYFRHTMNAAKALFDRLGASPGDFRYAAFHQPVPHFAEELGARLGFSDEQIAPALQLNSRIGNTYAACTLLGLAATLDIVMPGERIFCVSYGSGAGADAFCLTAREPIISARKNRVPLAKQVAQRTQIHDYATYLRHTRHLQRGMS